MLTGCAQLQRRTTETSGTESRGAVTEPDVVDAPEQEPLPPTAPVAPRVGVIFGPGLFNTYAHIGVLKAFEESKIPIHVVAGLEWGSLPAALFAAKGLAHEVEWKMLRLEREDLPEKGFFSSRIKAKDISSLSAFFDRIVKGEQIHKGVIPFNCPTFSLEKGVTYWNRRGATAETIAQCMAYPPYFENRTGLYASPLSIADAARQLRSQGAEMVIYVDVLSGSTLFRKEDRTVYLPEYLLWAQVAAASAHDRPDGVDLTLKVPLGADIYNFEGRRTHVEKGLRSARPVLQDLANKYSF
jgi:predicted acylesterase/phospholipase RssA